MKEYKSHQQQFCKQRDSYAFTDFFFFFPSSWYKLPAIMVQLQIMKWQYHSCHSSGWYSYISLEVLKEKTGYYSWVHIMMECFNTDLIYLSASWSQQLWPLQMTDWPQLLSEQSIQLCFELQGTEDNNSV